MYNLLKNNRVIYCIANVIYLVRASTVAVLDLLCLPKKNVRRWFIKGILTKVYLDFRVDFLCCFSSLFIKTKELDCCCLGKYI